MSSTLHPLWKSQPPFLPRLDAASEFTARLVGGFSAMNDVAWSIAWQPVPSLVVSLPKAVETRYGKAFPFNGTSHKVNIPGVDLSSSGPGKQGFSITSVLYGGSQNGRMLFEQSVTADSNDGFYIYGITATALRFELNTATASFISKDIPYTLPTVPTIVQFIVDSAVSPAKVSILENGVLKASDTIVTAGYFANDTVYVGSRAGTSLFSNQTFGDTFIHAGPMTLDEAARFAANLWQMFSRRLRQIAIPSTAPPTGFFSPFPTFRPGL